MYEVKEVVGWVGFLVAECLDGRLVVEADDGVVEVVGKGAKEVSS